MRKKSERTTEEASKSTAVNSAPTPAATIDTYRPGDTVWYLSAGGQPVSAEVIGVAPGGVYSIRTQSGMVSGLRPDLIVAPPEGERGAGVAPAESEAEPRSLEWLKVDDDVWTAPNTCGLRASDDDLPFEFRIRRQGRGWAIDGNGELWVSQPLDGLNVSLMTRSLNQAKAACEQRNRDLWADLIVTPPTDGKKGEAGTKEAEPADTTTAAEVERYTEATTTAAEVAAASELAAQPAASPSDELPDLLTWQRIRDAREDERKAERRVADLQIELKAAKADLEEASLRLGDLIDQAKWPGLFTVKVSGSMTAVEDLIKPAVVAAAPTPDTDAWRQIPVAEVVTDAKLAAKLTDAGIATFGDLETLRGNRWEPKVKGLGEKARAAIDDAVVAWWVAHPAEGQAAGKPTADAVNEQPAAA